MPSLRVEGLSKTYTGPDRTRVQAVQSLDFCVPEGECLSLVGPSGCGKTTTLRLIAGLETVDRGKVWLGDRELTPLKPAERGVAFLFQSAGLYPHLNVRENIGFPLKVNGRHPTETTSCVVEALNHFGLNSLADRLPEFLSGGERQRVALARAWIQKPKVLLLDEPFNGLDAPGRMELRRLLKQLQKECSIAVVHVTHDQHEALAMGDRVAVLRSGILQQLDGPDRIYHAPQNIFTASFIGSPGMNLIEGYFVREDGGVYFVATRSNKRLPIAVPVRIQTQTKPRAVLGFRPEVVSKRQGLAEADGFAADWVECRGPDWVEGGSWYGVPIQLIQHGSKPSLQARCPLEIPPDQLHWFNPESGERL